MMQVLMATWLAAGVADPVLIILAGRADRGGDTVRAERLRRHAVLVTVASFGALVLLWPVFLVWAA